MSPGETHSPMVRHTTGLSAWQLATLVGHVLLVGLALTLAQSILWSPDAGWVLKGLAVGIGVLSFWAPQHGLFAVATLTPLSVVLTRELDAYPVRTGEALVLAFLAGFALHRLYSMADTYRSSVNPESTWPRLPRQTVVAGERRQDESPARPWLLSLALVAIGSCVAQLATQQLWQDYPLPFAEQVWRYLLAGYHGPVGDLRLWVRPPSFEYIAVTVLFVTGIMLAIATERLVSQNRTIARTLAAALVLGGVIASLSSFVSSSDGTGSTLFAMLTSEARWSGFTGKVSSAGSFLVLIAGVALGGLGARTPFAPFWAAGAGITAAALLLTGTRSAFVAVAVISVGALVYWARKPTPQRSQRLPWVALCVSAVVGAVLFLRWDALVNYLPTALQQRWGLTITSLRMLQSEPLFGLGISQFYPLSAQFSSAELVTINATTYQGSNTNAHNNFLQIATELGLVGLAAFVMSLYVPIRTSWRRVWTNSDNRLLLGTFAGVVCFLITCLAGQPLIIASIAYPFWIAFGFLAALSNADAVTIADKATSSPGRAVWRCFSSRVVVATLLIVTALTMTRAGRDRSEVDLIRVDYGLYNWEADGVGVNYRWSGRDATVFLASDVNEVNVPLRAAVGFSGHPATVTIMADGQPVDTVVLRDDAWSHVAVPLRTGGSREVHRLDLNVSPTWRPSEIDPNSRDERLLGVIVGEISGRDATGHRPLISRPSL